MEKLFIFTLLLIASCTLTAPRPQNTTSADNTKDLTGIQTKINEAKAGRFGELVAEIHHAGKELEKAQDIQDNIKAGKQGFNAAEGYAAASKAVVHRNKAESAFDALFQMNTGDLNKGDFEQRLSYLESLHVPKNLNIPVTNIYFSFGGHRVQATEQSKIKDIIKFLRYYPVFALKLVGYADTVGNKERNILLAERRNSAVLEALRKQGLPTSTVVSVASGEVDGLDETKNQENRRVEVVPYIHGDYEFSGKKRK